MVEISQIQTDLFLFIFLFGVSFITTYFSTPIYIRKFTKSGYTVPDMYKKNKPLVPTLGGLAIVGGILVTLTFGVYFIQNIEILLIFYFIVFTYAMFGLLDDLINVKNSIKIVAPFFMALPIGLLNTDTTIAILGIVINFGVIYPFIFAPLTVMIVANLINLHSGFNGLQSGCSLLIISFIIVKVIIDSSNIATIAYILPLYGALLAFWIYNRYPARLFEGNIGSMAIGAGIGGFIVLLNTIEFYAVFLLIPHIITFLHRFIFYTILRRKPQKFGGVDEKNKLVVNDPWQLRFTLPFFRKVSEQQATRFMYLITSIFGIAGLFLI